MVPEQIAMTTSLNVQSNTRRTWRASSSGMEVYEKRRCAQIGWLNGVRGAAVSGRAGG